MNPFTAHFKKRGYYARVAVNSGVQRITVEFAPGYISIYSSSPYQTRLYITRSAALELFKKTIPILRVMAKHRYPDFDVPQAMHQSYLDEMAMTQALRLEKKAPTLESRRRQQQRYLRARERAQRRSEASSTE